MMAFVMGYYSDEMLTEFSCSIIFVFQKIKLLLRLMRTIRQFMKVRI